MLNLDTDNSILVPQMNTHQNVNKKYKVPQRITWHILWSQPPQTVPLKGSRDSPHPIESHYLFMQKEQMCGTNSRSLSVINLILTRFPNLQLISNQWKCWWTERSKIFKELELTQNLWSGTLNEWILPFVHIIKCWCGQLISIHTVSWIIIENN